MASTVNILNAEENSCKEWGKMLVAPQDHLVRAPSLTPYLCTSTRITRTIDIAYDDTTNGNFSVIQNPDVFSAYSVVTNTGDMPAVNEAISVTPQSGSVSNVPRGEKTISGGIYSVSSSINGDVYGSTSTSPISGTGTIFDGQQAFRVTTTNPSVINVQVQNLSSIPVWLQAFIITDTNAIGYGEVLPLSPGFAGTSFPSATSSAVIKYIGVAFTDPSGTPIASTLDLPCIMAIFDSSMRIVGGAVTSNLFRSSLLEVSQLSTYSCRSMSMLVTNMASSLNNGGELVIGRVPQSLVNANHSNTALVNAIRALPEQLYWRSGALADGGYVWYLPNDMESYEPRDLGVIPRLDNCNVATGNMVAEGIIRVIMTWTFDFYSTAQVFPRDYGPTWTPAHHDVYAILTRKPAVSANAGHLALIASVMAAAGHAFEFYLKHRKEIHATIGMASNALRPPKKASAIQKAGVAPGPKKIPAPKKKK